MSRLVSILFILGVCILTFTLLVSENGKRNGDVDPPSVQAMRGSEEPDDPSGETGKTESMSCEGALRQPGNRAAFSITCRGRGLMSDLMLWPLGRGGRSEEPRNLSGVMIQRDGRAAKWTLCSRMDGEISCDFRLGTASERWTGTLSGGFQGRSEACLNDIPYMVGYWTEWNVGERREGSTVSGTLKNARGCPG